MPTLTRDQLQSSNVEVRDAWWYIMYVLLSGRDLNGATWELGKDGWL